jgi:hypothetical protein
VQLTEDVALCITGQMMGATPRFKAIEALGKHVGISEELLKRARKLKGSQYEVAEDRNRVVHDPWFYIREQGEGDSVRQLKASPPGYVHASEAEITETISRIRNLIIQAANLQIEFKRELHTLRQTQL